MSETWGEFMDIFGNDEYLHSRARFRGELPIIYAGNLTFWHPEIECDGTVADVYDWGYRVRFDCLPHYEFYASECEGLWRRL